MKNYVFIFLLFALLAYSFGCGKKQPSLEEMQEPLSMEALSTLNTTTAAAPEAKVQATQSVSKPQPELQPLPPSGPYKPTATEIQNALKNAGYYAAAIDGNIGPLSKKAIEEFQKANGLQADGKVGPKTWAVLSTYLKSNAAADD